MFSRRRHLSVALLIAGLSLLLVASVGRAQFTDHYWQGAGTGGDTSGNPSDPSTQWNQSANWSGGVVPDHYEQHVYFWFTNAGTAYAPAGTTDIHELDIDGTSTGASFVIDASVTELLPFKLYAGRDGIGNVTQTGGTVRSHWGMSVGTHENAVGTYNMVGGDLYVPNHDLDVAYNGVGYFVHTGGTVHASIVLSADGDGVGYYTLSDTGEIAGTHLIVGESGKGYYTQTGGTADFSSRIWVGSYYDLAHAREGVVAVSGGSLTGKRLILGTDGHSSPFDATFSVQGAGATVEIGVDGMYMCENATLESQLDAVGLSAIQVNGEVTLDGTWEVVDNGAGLGQFEVITTTGGFLGAFDTVVLPDGTWSYWTTADTLWLQHVPEPATMSLLALGGLALLKRRRE